MAGNGVTMKSPRRTFIIPILILALCSLYTPSIQAQSNQWAIKMFSEMGTERLHNFGSVALHADVEKRFQFKNIYNEDVVIESVSSNCGCTKASASKSVVHPNEIGEIIARVDTSGREHTKQRKATIRIVFSHPTVSEVQLQVKTYIRPDVGFEPGVIEFGTVPHGTSVVKKAYLQYEGRSDWALTGIQKNNPGVKAEAREVRRTDTGVLYEILVELKNTAPSGYINDLLKFQTNETNSVNSSIFLPIKGLVVEPLCAKPSYLQLGVLSCKSKITKNIVVSASLPFKILQINSEDSRLSGIKTNLKRTVHVIPVTYQAGANSGEIRETIEIVTDLKGKNDEAQKIVVDVIGMVIDSESLSEE